MLVPIHPFTIWSRGRRSVATAAVCLALAIAGGASMPAAAKVMQAPGSRVSVDLPDAFKASPVFAGFMELISSAAVIVREVPAAAYDKVVAGLSPEVLARKGIKDATVGQLKRAGDYFYVKGEQAHPRGVFEKFILVLRDSRNTAVITVNVPKGSFVNGSIRRGDVIKALTSARLEAEAAPSRDLFKLAYLGPFERIGQPTGTSRSYATTDDSGPKDARNVLVVSPSLNRLPIKSLRDFSQYALQSLRKQKDVTVTANKDMQVDGMAGHLVTATAKRGASQTPVVIRQLILQPAAGGYYRLLAVTKAADEARLAPQIAKVFASFKAVGTRPAQ